MEGLPPYPGDAIVGRATVPAPPKLDPEGSDLALATQLAATYRRVVEHRTGKPCWAFKNGDLRRSRFFKLLVDAARALVERDIAPAAWIAWRLDQAKGDALDRGRKDWVVPHLGQILSPKEIRRPRGWHSTISTGYAGGTALMTPKHRELLARYRAMRAEVAAARAWKDPSAIVARHFPKGYALSLEAAQAEVAAKRAELRELAASGACLW